MRQWTKYAVQFRNPDFMRTYNDGVEFSDRDVAIEQAKLAVDGGLLARVVKVEREIIWHSREDP